RHIQRTQRQKIESQTRGTLFRAYLHVAACSDEAQRKVADHGRHLCCPRVQDRETLIQGVVGARIIDPKGRICDVEIWFCVIFEGQSYTCDGASRSICKSLIGHG
ncbi:hypothetical protein BaRGS_00017741, partial [Batillaria attramentaria]